jgi:hypothetical protein
MKKHITRKAWEYIGKYNPAAKWLRPFCSYTLEEIEDGYRRVCKISWPVYLVILIPAHILQALYCMWDGGLKEFEVAGRHLGYDDIHETWGSNEGAYPKAKEIWERK